MMIKQLLSAVTFSGMAALTSQAAVIADWDFSGASGTVPDADITPGSTLIDATNSGAVTGISSSDLLSGGSLRYENAGGAAGELNLKNFHITSGNGRGSFSFTLTADPGKTIEVTSLTMSSYRNGGGAPTQLQWHVTVDGGTEEEYGTEQVGQLTPFAVDTFTESITGATTVKFEFRLDNATGNGNIHFNDIQVNGSVNAVPEPSSAALVGLGGLSLILRRRK
ncbi:PEP-CTERM sorting domain-containing protein [Verrucomicrobiaceae bacterium N1E253]|uniref:PEP-CTERM sorting domain-containing protein n=1 Tax=Oceaniferula marina TaxID=2748318 RepID=A0A851GF33_9BACT|nr:PEP-CTERM sorting domain-containing protein [Oceaniferula marina]NWK55799.1 PEP-CTERM sorting domain-containing protein [Oceaniferula marina]